MERTKTIVMSRGDTDKTILLVQPEDGPGRGLFRRLWQPLDLANMAGLLEGRGFEVRIVDNRVERLPVHKIAALARKAHLVLVTSAAFDRWQCPPLEIPGFLRLVAALDKKRLCIMGPHVSERTEVFLRQTGSWAALVGEPEQTLLGLCERDPADGPPIGVAGAAFIDDGGMYHSEPYKKREQGAFFPLPAFDHLSMDRYHYPLMPRPFTLLEGSRGCPFRCRFCYRGMHPSKPRTKDPRDLADEALAVKERYNTPNIYFMDLEFGLDRGFVETFCRELIRINANVTWCCQTRATDVDGALLGLMKEAGCSLIHVGAESASKRILSRMGKGVTPDDCARVVRDARKAGIRTALFFGLGFPGETRTEMQKTVALSIALDPDYASFHRVMPICGTDLHRETGLAACAPSWDRYPACCPDQDQKELDRMIRVAYLTFYMRPKCLLRIVRQGGVLPLRTFEWFIHGVGRN